MSFTVAYHHESGEAEPASTLYDRGTALDFQHALDATVTLRLFDYVSHENKLRLLAD
jgi:hypothetical protein